VHVEEVRSERPPDARGAEPGVLAHDAIHAVLGDGDALQRQARVRIPVALAAKAVLLFELGVDAPNALRELVIGDGRPRSSTTAWRT
jgi:hypothetical protein